MSTPHKYRQTTIDRAIAQSVYITDDMINASVTLREVAIDFVATYVGFNSFVQDLALRLADRGVLSPGQMRGALNVMIREAKDARPAPATNGVYIDLRSKKDLEVETAGAPPAVEDQPADDRQIPNGYYTIIVDEATDAHRTIKLEDAPEHFNAAAGTQIAKYLSGADNEASYTGFAFVVGRQIRVWKKFSGDSRAVSALRTLVETADPIEYMLAYGMRFDHCGVCGRRLTTPESKRAGIGPICAGKIEAAGYSVSIPAETRVQARTRAIDEMNELFPE